MTPTILFTVLIVLSTCGAFVAGYLARAIPRILISIKVGGSARPVIMGTVEEFARKCRENGGAMRARFQGVTLDVVDLSITPPKKETEE